MRSRFSRWMSLFPQTEPPISLRIFHFFGWVEKQPTKIMNPTILVGREKITSEEWKPTCFHDKRNKANNQQLLWRSSDFQEVEPIINSWIGRIRWSSFHIEGTWNLNLNVNGFTSCRESTTDGPSLWKKIRCCSGCVRFHPVSRWYDYDWLHLVAILQDGSVQILHKNDFCVARVWLVDWQEEVISRTHNLSHVFQHYMAWPWLRTGEAQCFVFSCRQGTAQTERGQGFDVARWFSGIITEGGQYSILVAKKRCIQYLPAIFLISRWLNTMNDNLIIYWFNVFASLVSFGNCLSSTLWCSLPVWWCNDLICCQDKWRIAKSISERGAGRGEFEVGNSFNQQLKWQCI